MAALGQKEQLLLHHVGMGPALVAGRAPLLLPCAKVKTGPAVVFCIYIQVPEQATGHPAVLLRTGSLTRMPSPRSWIRVL